MGFEIPIDVAYWDHRKTVDLMTRLKDKQGDIWPLRLWKWAATNARDGVIRVNPRTLEVALGWPGDRLHPPGRLFQALKCSGFVDVKPDSKNSSTTTIHDWMEGIGRAIFLYECKKQRQREKYSQKEDFRNSAAESGIIPPIRETLDMKPGIRNPGGDSTPPRSEASPAGPPDPALLAFAFCQTPGPKAKLAAIEDLRRQGVKDETILNSAKDPARQAWDFFDHIRALRPARAQRGAPPAVRVNPPIVTVECGKCEKGFIRVKETFSRGNGWPDEERESLSPCPDCKQVEAKK